MSAISAFACGFMFYGFLACLRDKDYGWAIAFGLSALINAIAWYGIA